MSKQIVSQKKASTAYLSIFLIGLGILIWTSYWWPGIMVVLGLAISVRQFLLGHNYDAWVSIGVFGAITFLSLFKINWDVILPVIFIVAGLYIFFRDFIDFETRSEMEIEEDLSIEIEEEIKENKKK